jgi:hypothetical protein
VALAYPSSYSASRRQTLYDDNLPRTKIEKLTQSRLLDLDLDSAFNSSFVVSFCLKVLSYMLLYVTVSLFKRGDPLFNSPISKLFIKLSNNASNTRARFKLLSIPATSARVYVKRLCASVSVSTFAGSVDGSAKCFVRKVTARLAPPLFRESARSRPASGAWL